LVAARLMPLEKLDFFLVLLRGRTRGKRSEVTALVGLWIDLARIETVPTRFEFPNHLASPFECAGSANRRLNIDGICCGGGKLNDPQHNDPRGGQYPCRLKPKTAAKRSTLAADR